MKQLKKALVCVNGKGLIGSVYVKSNAAINPKSTFIFKFNRLKATLRVKDIQFLMVKVPNKKAFNFLYNGQLYTTDSKNYPLFKSRWDAMFNLSMKGC